MNRSLLRNLGALCAMLAFATNLSFAQTARIQNQIVSKKDAPPTMGRDFWFAMPSNYWGVDNGGKYIRIYITSPQNTTAIVAVGENGGVPVPVSAYKISTFQIKESWEMESSGYIESKAIHVWSNDAPLSVYVMSHNAYSSDGSYIIPTEGLGTDYVVAAYASLYELNWDDPSEFTIAASEDNSIVDITPSCDLRHCLSGNESGDSCSLRVGFPKGKTFTDTLQRGESIEFKPVQAQADSGYDVTGTVIHSNHPIGVIGGSDCANIPADFPYCDHVEHMIPPVRTWGETYYSTSFVQPATMQGHDFGLYLMISSKPNQTIFRSDYVSGKHVEAVLTNKNDIYWDELEGPKKFWSDAPFLLVEYMNSTSYPDNTNGNGDPAEVVIPSSEQYAKTVVFQSPISVGAQAPYDSYANIIINKWDEHQTRFDGQNILAYTHQPIDDTFEVFTVPHIAPDAHVISGDTLGVGVTVYGYGWDESYAWSGALGIATYDSPDTVAPKVTISGACDESFVHLADAGVNPGGIPQSKLSSIQFDSSFNMSYTLDPNWQEGSGADTSGYSISVLDPTMTGYLRMEVFDQAGNRTMITSTYLPHAASIEPPLQNFGTAIAPAKTFAYDTLVNTGKVTYKFTTLALRYGNLGFTIDSGASPDSLRVGERRIIKIAFQAVKTSTVIDSLILADDCGTISAALIGNGGAADFFVTDQNWMNEALPPPTNGYVKAVSIQNLSAVPITVDTAWWADTHFVAVDTLPITLAGEGSTLFRIAYFPDANSAIVPNRTQGTWRTTGNAIGTDSLIGSAAASSVANGNEPYQNITLYPNPTTGLVTITGASGLDDRSSVVEVENVLGESVMRDASCVTRNGKAELDMSRLPAGTYFVRISGAQDGKDGRTTVWRIVKQ